MHRGKILFFLEFNYNFLKLFMSLAEEEEAVIKRPQDWVCCFLKGRQFPLETHVSLQVLCMISSVVI